MDELAAWLRRQAEEDIARARDAGGEVDGDYVWRQDDAERAPGRIETAAGQVVTYDEGSPDDGQAAHIAAHDPRTEIARAESVLAVLGAYETAWSLAEKSWDREESDRPLYDQARALRRAVCLLASGYRYREGWKAEWAA